MEQQQAKRVYDPYKWKPGKYKAKPIDWMVTKTKDGLPRVAILFEYEQAGDMPGKLEKKSLTWYGSFKGGALERTMEALEMLGLRQEPYPAMETGREGKALDENAEVEIVVEHKMNDKGTVQAGVSWVNRVGGRGLETKLEEGEGSRVFAEANSAYRSFLASKGVGVQSQPTGAGAPKPKLADDLKAQGSFTEEDIPF